MLCRSMLRTGPLAAIVLGVLATAACGKGSTSTPSPTPSSHSIAGQISAIASAGSTCKQFSAGTLSELTHIQYTNSGSKVARVAPPTFDYWVKVVSPKSPLTTLTVIETTHGATAPVTSSGGDAFSSSAGGACVTVSNSVSYAAGVTKVSFAGTAGTTYFAQVHFNAAGFVGQSLAPRSVSLTVSTTEVTGSTTELSLTAA